MVEKGAQTHEGGQNVAEVSSPLCLAIASRGIKTAEDFANMMSALMSDVIAGRLPPSVANATCNAGGKLLKVVEMQYRYAPPPTGGKSKSLLLAPGGDSDGEGE